MGLQENMNREPVSRLALREPVLCSPGDSVRTAVERMRKQTLGCVFVVDADRKPIGMFTESMLTQLLARDPAALDHSLESQMAKEWPSANRGDPIVGILIAMQRSNARFVCVVDDDGRVSALAGQKGLMEYVAEHFPNQVMVQRVGCAPYRSREGA